MNEVGIEATPVEWSYRCSTNIPFIITSVIM